MKFDKIKPLEGLSLFAKQVVDGFITGIHKSPYHGFSVEFAEHRLYNTGESTRHIDWKLFGRSDKLFVKRYEEETNLRCQLILDTSSSMYYPNFQEPTLREPNKLFFSIYASAVLMNLLKRQKDAIGLSTFNNDVDIHIPPKTTSRHHQLLYYELESALKIDAITNKRKSNFSESIHQIADRIHSRSLVILFTDMIVDDNLNNVFEAFNHLKYNMHEVVLFHLSEPKTEHNFIFENRPYKFVDIESGDELKVNPMDIQEYFQDMSESFLKELRLKCLQHKIDLVEVDINKGFNQILSSYLVKREKYVR